MALVVAGEIKNKMHFGGKKDDDSHSEVKHNWKSQFVFEGLLGGIDTEPFPVLCPLTEAWYICSWQP